jgi:dephospho-CoA kinase
MGGPGSILRAGLTGGIASGKSTVAGFLARLGAFVIDADVVTRQVMAPGGPAYARVVERFGKEILDADGRIDRVRLARRVFGDGREREALNALVHPEVRAEAQARFDRCAADGAAKVGILDAALLVETGYYEQLDRLVVVRCSASTQRRRLARRDGLEITDADARIAAQAPLAQKLAVADYVIDNEGDLEKTRQQTEKVYTELLRDRERLYGGWQE